MRRPSPGPSWTILEPPSISPTPTTRSDADLGGVDEDTNLNTHPAKRKAGESPVSVPRPLKVPRLNDNDRRDKGSQVSSDKRTNVATLLTQAPNIKKSRPSFLSQPTRAPPMRPGKGKSRASSPQSTSSLSDHISKMVDKQNQRFRRIETARKSTRKRRVTTSGLIRDVQKSSSGSEVSSAVTRVRRASGRAFPRSQPSLGRDVIELTDSSDSTRRRKLRNDDPIIILSSDAGTPPRQSKPSQKPNSRNACPRRPLPSEAEVICISDSDDNTVPAPPPVTAVPPAHEPNIRLSLSPTRVFESVDNDRSFYIEPPEYYPGPDDDQVLATSELQQQTEELFSYINLDPPEQDNTNQIASPSAEEDSNVTQDPPLPAPNSPTDLTILLDSKKATEISSNEDVSVKGVDNLPRLESFTGSQTSLSTPHPPSQTLLTTVPTIIKPPVTWKYAPPSTNPFFARTLSFNAKVLKKSLPFAQTSSESTTHSSPAVVVASPAAVESSTNILPKPLMGRQPSDALAEASKSVLSHSPVISSSRDVDTSLKPPPADKTVVSVPLQLLRAESCDAVDAPTTRSDVPHTGEQSRPEYPSMDVPDISIPPATAPSSSSPIPVPPRVQRSTTKLSLTELINQTRERHIKARFIDLTDEVSPLRDGNAASSAFASKPHESMQPPSTKAAGPVSASQPAPSNEIRTPSIQEIRDLMRQRPSSNKLSTSSAADNPSTSSAATDPSTSSVASNPSSSSIASATSPLVPSRSPPRSFMSNSTTSTTQSGSKPSSRRKSRAMGVASLEMYISPIKDASQPASSKKKTWTPRSGKRMSYNADKFRSIITPTADATVRSQSLSPSEGRELRRPAGFADTGTDAALAVLSSPSAQTRVPFGAPPVRHEEPEATPSTLPSAIPLTEVQKLESGKLHTHEGFSPRENAVHDMFRPEGIQGVTESIGSLDLREDSWSPNVDIDIDQVRQLSLENVCEDGVQAIPVSTELMEHEEFESMEELVGNVSAGSVAEAPASLGKYRESNEEDGDADTRAIRTSAERTSGTSDVSGEISEQEECLAVLMELEVSDREAGDAEHPNSISSSRTASSHVSSRQTPETLRSAEPLNVVRSGGAASIGQLEDGVESYLGGYPIVTWKSYANAQRRLPPKYNLAKDLPHELQDRVNALPQSYRNSDQARLLFEAMIDEAMDDELNTPPISVINDVTDEGAPPWEFVYTNQMWNGEGVPPPDIKNLKSCGCVGRCDPKSKTCSCAKRQRRHLKQYIEDDTIPKTWNGAPFVYDGKGCLQFFGLPIFECNAFCGCDEDCPNRVVQRGRRYVVNIKKTKNKGWGVFNGQKKIPKGSFIGVYAGELLTVGEADRRGTLYNKFGRTYLFDIDFHHMGSEAVYSVDAYHAGNLTRFLNHSCDPNCEIQACYINEANFNKPLLTVFTVREVEPLEELSFSYMGQIDDDMVNHAKASNDAVYAECHCGSANCLGVLFSGL